MTQFLRSRFRFSSHLLSKLKNQSELLQSPVVANNLMNRGRGVASYARELGFDPVEHLLEKSRGGAGVAWLDIACGEGRALIEASARLEEKLGEAARWRIVGLDLAGLFRSPERKFANLELLETSVEDFAPDACFDLITCVHGLHYVGDKLGALARCAGWLKDDGLFAAHLEMRNLKLAGSRAPARVFSAFLRGQGFAYDSRKTLLRLAGRRLVAASFEYLGADDLAGPNSTGQPVVDSHYRN